MCIRDSTISGYTIHTENMANSRCSCWTWFAENQKCIKRVIFTSRKTCYCCLRHKNLLYNIPYFFEVSKTKNKHPAFLIIWYGPWSLGHVFHGYQRLEGGPMNPGAQGPRDQPQSMFYAKRTIATAYFKQIALYVHYTSICQNSTIINGKYFLEKKSI